MSNDDRSSIVNNGNNNQCFPTDTALTMVFDDGADAEEIFEGNVGISTHAENDHLINIEQGAIMPAARDRTPAATEIHNNGNNTETASPSLQKEPKATSVAPQIQITMVPPPPLRIPALPPPPLPVPNSALVEATKKSMAGNNFNKRLHLPRAKVMIPQHQRPSHQQTQQLQQQRPPYQPRKRKTPPYNNGNDSADNKTVIEVPLEVRGERLTLTQAGLKVMYPTKAARLMDAMRNHGNSRGAPLVYDKYDDGDHDENASNANKSSHTLNKYADDLDKFMYCTSGGNPILAASILRTFLRKKHVAPVRQELLMAESSAAASLQQKEKGLKAKRDSQLQQNSTAVVDSLIVQGLNDFLYSHRTISARRKHEQDAVDAVLTAACSADKRYLRSKRTNSKKNSAKKNSKNQHQLEHEQQQPFPHPFGELDGMDNNDDYNNYNNNYGESNQNNIGDSDGNNHHDGGDQNDNQVDDDFPLEKVASRLGRAPEQMALYRSDMAGKLFVPRKQKTREDYYRINPVAACIVDFCHSDEASCNVTENEDAKYAYKPVVSPVTGEQEEHRLRLWHEPTFQQRYKVFLRSSFYQDFLARQQQSLDHHLHGHELAGIRTIDFATFQKSACNCVREFHPKGRDRKVKKKHKPAAAVQPIRAAAPPPPPPPLRCDDEDGEVFYNFLQARDRYL